jgi:hypothetical protein
VKLALRSDDLIVQLRVSISMPSTEFQRHSRVETIGLVTSDAGNDPRAAPGAVADEVFVDPPPPWQPVATNTPMQARLASTRLKRAGLMTSA